MGANLILRQVRQIRGGYEILRVDDLDVCDGEHVSVLGPNGAGKTTMLRLLAGVDRPASGTVTLDGVDTTRGGVELRRQVAYATQQPGLLSTSVRRNVELPLRWRKVPRKERARVATAALERLRVAHLADRRAHELSGGEQQRVNLARALALDPSVLLLDEPAAGLDAQTRSAFFADLEQALADRTATVVQVSHRAEEALRFADRVVVLVDGRVHQVGAPDALTLRPADASVAALVGYDNLVDATVRPDGSVLVGGAPTGLVHLACRCESRASPPDPVIAWSRSRERCRCSRTCRSGARRRCPVTPRGWCSNRPSAPCSRELPSSRPYSPARWRFVRRFRPAGEISGNFSIMGLHRSSAVLSTIASNRVAVSPWGERVCRSISGSIGALSLGPSPSGRTSETRFRRHADLRPLVGRPCRLARYSSRAGFVGADPTSSHRVGAPGKAPSD
jgi:ABC-type Fe3+/spermidine/putrescine transport system ATPase subunit